MTELSIIVVTYNCQRWVERCFTSIPAGLGTRNAELIVVDNASSDGSVETVRRLRPDAVLATNETNTGFAAAVNQGVLLSRAPWVLLLNPDTESQPAAFDKLLTFAEDNPGHGIYGGRTTNPGGEVQPSSCWALPTVWSTICFAFGLSALFMHSPVFDPESMGHWPRDTVREVGMVTGCLMLVPRSVWDELGGMDERYFVYGEDADFAARARSRGYRPIITPDAALIHEVGTSSSNDAAKVVLLMAGKITFARAHLPGIQGRAAVGFLRLGVGLHALGSALTGRGNRWVGAWRRRSEWWDGYPART